MRCALQGETSLPEPTEAEIDEANKLKEEGNELMKQLQFDAAVNKYNEAIKLNRDPVYFCNRYAILVRSFSCDCVCRCVECGFASFRAAAYCRMEQYDLAIQDCRTALALDPTYSKAYGRMGCVICC